jgi:hypothetical protein
MIGPAKDGLFHSTEPKEKSRKRRDSKATSGTPRRQIFGEGSGIGHVVGHTVSAHTARGSKI